jgi:arabinofuranan 3-O-arabinosyltransferase
MGIGELHLSGLDGLARDVPRGWKLRTKCGLGPDVHVNGRLQRTRVVGRLGAIVTGGTLRWRTCGGPVRLDAGIQDLAVDATDVFTPTRVVLASTVPTAAPFGTERALLGATAVGDSATMRIDAGPAGVVFFGQNTNAGWRATLDGKPLRSIVVDGWQQGFVVPAGIGGRIRISYPPGATYRVALVAGGVAALVLVLLLCLDLFRSQRPQPIRVVRWGGRLTLVAGVLGVGVLAALGGVAVAGALLVALVARGRRVPTAAISGVGGLLVLVSAIAAVYSPAIGNGPSPVANLAAAVAVGLLAAAAAPFGARETVDDGG